MNKVGTAILCTGMILSLTLGGCTSLSDKSIAGGNCARETIYSFGLDIPVFPFKFNLAARCETLVVVGEQ